jgi:hypothetical protein
LTVDAGNQTHAISPYVYGMNAYLLDGSTADATAVAPTHITVDRWGGDSTERYNYQLDVTNDISDYYFENSTGNAGDGWLAVPNVSAFDALVTSNSNKCWDGYPRTALRAAFRRPLTLIRNPTRPAGAATARMRTAWRAAPNPAGAT